MPDLFEQMFNDDTEEEVEYYPGSKRKRRPEPEPQIAGDMWRENYTVKTVGGAERRFFPIGALADALHVSVETIRHWVKKGQIPNAPYRLSTSIVHGKKHPGRRLYTEPMIDATVKAFASRGLLDAQRIEWKKHHDLTIELHETWSRIHREESVR
jgi:hypothetical protein